MEYVKGSSGAPRKCSVPGRALSFFEILRPWVRLLSGTCCRRRGCWLFAGEKPKDPDYRCLQRAKLAAKTKSRHGTQRLRFGYTSVGVAAARACALGGELNGHFGPALEDFGYIARFMPLTQAQLLLTLVQLAQENRRALYWNAGKSPETLALRHLRRPSGLAR